MDNNIAWITGKSVEVAVCDANPSVSVLCFSLSVYDRFCTNADVVWGRRRLCSGCQVCRSTQSHISSIQSECQTSSFCLSGVCLKLSTPSVPLLSDLTRSQRGFPGWARLFFCEASSSVTKLFHINLHSSNSIEAGIYLSSSQDCVPVRTL